MTILKILKIFKLVITLHKLYSIISFKFKNNKNI